MSITEKARWFLNHNIGYDLVRFSGQHNLRAHLSRLLDEYQIDIIIDVGANEGQFGLFLRSIGFKGGVYSFEPVADAYAKLEEVSAKDEQWHTFNFALGSEPGESYINVSNSTSFSSLLTPSDYALDHWENSHVDHKQKIFIKTLSDCYSEGMFPESKRIFLKMDTQGYDLEVFKGADAMLSNVCAILSELSLIAVYNDMPDYKQSLSVFESSGFSVSGMYPITRNKDLSLNEMDCVLVKTGL